MTDWNRVEKLRRKGYTWDEIARDPGVGFRSDPGTSPGRALKTLHRERRNPGSGARPSGGAARHRSAGWSGTRLAILGGVFVVLAVLVIVVGPYFQRLDAPGNWVGRTAPDFTLSSTNGTSFTLSADRGHTNVLLFFNEGLSCYPCLQQMISLDQDANEFHQQGVTIVQITGNSLSDLTTWARSSGIAHTMILADPTLKVSNAYDTTGASVSMMPGVAPGHSFFLVDRSGTVLWRADYGPTDMSVPDSQILQAVVTALGS